MTVEVNHEFDCSLIVITVDGRKFSCNIDDGWGHEDCAASLEKLAEQLRDRAAYEEDTALLDDEYRGADAD